MVGEGLLLVLLRIFSTFNTSVHFYIYLLFLVIILASSNTVRFEVNGDKLSKFTCALELERRAVGKGKCSFVA